ncbi:hypothetical protein MYCTH_95630 [Thermothelomyces thermophilus ATCC 42464]|uniref:Uncharacterized protein n=1 Tax=Thermothelomyces thermophilus (strain ATCC 42464 / BCRC 31852 / DSM 1799) TaxID=573729 RepID=G2QI89_THET4|nr:uncharacterized protein MYCTH_95630 [Thermothelomyces thermophilus ATCC 42464]AEO60278.1 hypothetical protein MYCTH_95630 [Thermothelomyces thermophilus ATCC 42464]
MSVLLVGKYVEVDKRPRDKLNPDQWHALTALHSTLLHEHHHFFLACQHPLASPAVRGLAERHAIPAPYSMIALLFETAPAFEDTWIKCLGELARYYIRSELVSQ